MIRRLNIITKRKVYSVYWLLFAIILGKTILFSCRSEVDLIPFYEGIYEGINESIGEYVLTRDDEYSLFGRLMEAGSLEWTLTAYNPHGNNYTLFLPTDEAIESFISQDNRYNTFEDLLDDVDYVYVLVRYHVVNKGIRKNDFPFGALSDTTLSGDLINIGFVGGMDSTVLKVNNEASIIQPDLQLINGYIHVIDKVLKPVVNSSYEWLADNDGYSIFASALLLTQLSDTFKIGNELEGYMYLANTLLVESDNVFEKSGIFSVDDLIEKYSPDRQDYHDFTNGLFQFVAYHILEKKYFLNNLEGQNTNYNSYGSLPVLINGTGLEIKINPGVAIFDSIITENDTVIINYIGIDYENSNIATKNGAIHTINNLLEVFRPKPVERIFQFLEEPMIFTASQSPGEYVFKSEDLDKFEVISWEGPEKIAYTKSPTALTGIWGADYLEIQGDFRISYILPRILPGNYLLQIKANDEDRNNATIQVVLDGKSIGGNIDLTADPNKNSTFNRYNIGAVVFDNYVNHTIEIRTLVPGKFTWDAVVLVPN